MPRLHHITFAAFAWATVSTAVIAQTSTAPSTSVVAQANAVGFTGTAKSPQAPSYETLIREAIALAKPEGKALFVYFGSSGCGWCHQLHDAFHAPETSPTISKYFVTVPVSIQELDDKEKLNNAGADSALEVMNMRGGTPMYAYLDTAGKAILTGVGFPEEVDMPGFIGEMKKANPKMTDADGKKITDYFDAHWKVLRKEMNAMEQRGIDEMNKKAMEARKEREKKS